MSALPQAEPPLSPRQVWALRRFEAFYPLLDRAIDAEDAEHIAALVEQRRATLNELIAAFAGGHLLESVRLNIESAEELVRERLERFYHRLLLRLSDEWEAAFARKRYQEKTR